MGLPRLNWPIGSVNSHEPRVEATWTWNQIKSPKRAAKEAG